MTELNLYKTKYTTNQKENKSGIQSDNEDTQQVTKYIYLG